MTSTLRLPDPGHDVRIGDVRWRFAPGEEPLEAALHGLVLDPWASLSGMELLRLNEKVFWGRLRLDGRAYFLKGRRVTRRRLRYLWRASAARREWRRTFALRARGIETLSPAAVGELSRHGLPRLVFFASRWCDGHDLAGYLEAQERVLAPQAFTALRGALAEELGALLGRLHHAGVVHRQFHWKNVFVVEGREGRRLLPIDCQHVGIPRRFRDADRAHNLRQVAWWMWPLVERWRPRRAEYLRFLRGYHAAAPESAGSFADLVRRVERVAGGRPPKGKAPPPDPALDRW